MIAVSALALAWSAPAPAPSAREAGTTTYRVAPAQRQLVPRVVAVEGNRRLRLRRSLVLRFDLAGISHVRSARLVVTARRAGAPLRLWKTRRDGGRHRLLHRHPVRGRAGRAKDGLVRVSFRVTRLVQARRPARFLVSAARGRWRPARGRVSLLVRGRGSSSPARPTPTPTPETPAPETPTPGPTATATPSPAGTSTASVLAAGDIACDPSDANFHGGAGAGNSCRQMATSDLLVANAVDAVLALGDLQYEDASLSQFQSAYDPSWGRVKSVTRPVLGNHEYYTPGAAGYFDYFNGVGAATGLAGDRGQGYYGFDVGLWHVVALNANCSVVACGPGSAQDNWLRADLAAHPVGCTLAFFHQPRFSSGQVGSDVSVTPLWRALYDNGVDLVLNGHAHDYERFAPQDPTGALDVAHGIRQIVVGTGGKSLHAVGPPIANSEVLNNDTLGVLEVTLRAEGYAWEFLPIAGGTFTDSGSGSCHGRP